MNLNIIIFHFYRSENRPKPKRVTYAWVEGPDPHPSLRTCLLEPRRASTLTQYSIAITNRPGTLIVPTPHQAPGDCKNSQMVRREESKKDDVAKHDGMSSHLNPSDERKPKSTCIVKWNVAVPTHDSSDSLTDIDGI